MRNKDHQLFAKLGDFIAALIIVWAFLFGHILMMSLHQTFTGGISSIQRQLRPHSHFIFFQAVV